MRAMAQATHNRGGLVIAQVKYIAAGGSLDARTVEIPGIYVDVIVHSPTQRQLVTDDYNPAFSGELTAALSSLPPFPLDQRKIVARRAIAEVQKGDVVNLGVGIADGIAAVAAEEGISSEFTLTVEQGIVGGIPARGVIFGVSTNPSAILDQPTQFDFYDGGGLDICFLGFAQIDAAGNVNVSKFGDKIIGTGGFVNISQNASTVVFCGTFTAGGLAAMPTDGRLHIEQRVLYVTERAVFELGSEGINLIELAPGVDLQTDVLDLLPFAVDYSHYISMDSALFRDALLGLSN
jgi:acyl CoA:acetate/3-ketoacid CoA transferase